MVPLHFDNYEKIVLTLSKEAYEILKKIQLDGGSPDDAVDSMILAADKLEQGATPLLLSKEAVEILQEAKRNGGSIDEMVNSVILAFDKCQIKPQKDGD